MCSYANMEISRALSVVAKYLFGPYSSTNLTIFFGSDNDSQYGEYGSAIDVFKCNAPRRSISRVV
jgi:hypothetical protein